MQQHNYLQKPFFAKFLENQRSEREGKANTQQGNLGMSSIFFDLPQTNKWPSDGDDDIPPIN